MIPFLSTIAAHPIIILFLFLNLAIGFWAHTKAKTNSFEDYALASRSLPTGVLVMTLLGTVLNMGTLGNSGLADYYGAIQFGTIISLLIGFGFIGTFIAPYLVYFRDCHTLGDLSDKMYGRTSRIFTGIISCVFCMLIIIPQIQAIAELGDRLLSIPPNVMIICFGGMTILYSVLGGARSVSYTDVFQIITIFVAISWIAHVVIGKVGGIEELFKGLSVDKTRIISHPEISVKLKAWLFWRTMPIYLLTPPVMQRMLMAQDKRQLRKMWYASALLYGIVLLMLILIGLSVASQSDKFSVEIGKTRGLLLRLIQSLFADQRITLNLLFLGLLSVGISTIDSFLHATGLLITKDIIEPVRNVCNLKPLGERLKIIYARCLVAIIGFLSICAALAIGSHPLNVILIKYAVLFFALVITPLLIGIIGIKTDRTSWIGFCVVYSSSMIVLKLLGWEIIDYFLISLPLGILAYFATHIYQNGGIVTLKRSELTIAEQLWIPTWQGTVKYMKSWLLAPFQLHTLASRKIIDNPTHPLSFSMLIFALYTFSSVMTGGGNDLGVANFMAGIHMIGITLCAGLMLEGIWPMRIKPYFALYWFFTLFYCLAFGSTLAFLRAHGDTMAVIKWMSNFMLLAFLVDSMSFVTLSCLGSGLAMTLWYSVFGNLPADLLGSIGLPGVYLLLILLVAVVLFECCKEKGLKERLYIKNAFSHAITHESTQPLSEISVLSTLQQRAIDELSPMQNAQGEKGFWIPASKQGMLQKGSQQIGKAVQEIKHEFGRFNKLIEDEISTLEKEKVSMQSLIESIVPTLPKKHTNRIKVKVECTKDFKASVMRPLFANVFANLLKNAYLHGNANEMHIHIEGSKRKLSIRDNGRGIKVEALPRIFELHFTTGGQTSNGVGLALVKSIVQASGGKISCHSRHGDKDSFTAFVIEFPEG